MVCISVSGSSLLLVEANALLAWGPVGLLSAVGFLERLLVAGEALGRGSDG